MTLNTYTIFRRCHYYERITLKAKSKKEAGLKAFKTRKWTKSGSTSKSETFVINKE